MATTPSSVPDALSAGASAPSTHPGTALPSLSSWWHRTNRVRRVALCLGLSAVVVLPVLYAVGSSWTETTAFSLSITTASGPILGDSGKYYYFAVANLSLPQDSIVTGAYASLNGSPFKVNIWFFGPIWQYRGQYYNSTAVSGSFTFSGATPYWQELPVLGHGRLGEEIGLVADSYTVGVTVTIHGVYTHRVLA